MVTCPGYVIYTCKECYRKIDKIVETLHSEQASCLNGIDN